MNAALAVAIATIVALSPGAAGAEPIALRAADGTPLSAVWLAPQRPAPAIVLVHMLTRTHAEWDQTAQSLNGAGFGVLALDLRGHGGSGGSSLALASMQQDVQAAVDWVKVRADVTSGHVGIAGASLGAALAVLVAAVDPAVRSLALLSPSSEYRGIRCDTSIRKYAERGGAMLLAASTGDPYALRTAHHFETMGGGPRDLRIVNGTSAHGTMLLTASPDLLTALVDWFRRSLL